MLRTFGAFGVALALAFSAGNAAAQQKIRIATEGAYEPFNYTDASGQLVGFEVDLARALCEKMKARCEIVAQDWDGIIPGLLAKRYDAIMASMSITPERKQRVAFSNKYYQTPARFVARKGANLQISPAGLKGKTVGVQRATIHANYAEDVYGKVATIRQYDTQENANLDLATGRLDAVLADSILMLKGFLEKPDGKAFEFVGPELTDPKYFGEGVGVAMRKEDKALAEAFNKAIREVRADGTYKRINDKYFPFDVYGE